MVAGIDRRIRIVMFAGFVNRKCGGRKDTRKLFALAAVALMLAIVIVPMATLWTGQASGVDTGRSSIKYHIGADVTPTEVFYDGVVSAEYNPVYWSSDNGKADWTAPTKKVQITVSVTITITFSDSSGNTFDLPDGMKIDNWNHSYNIGYRYYDNPTVEVKDGKLTIGLPHGLIGYPSGSITLHFTYSSQETVETVFAGWTKDAHAIDEEVDQSEIILPGEILNGDFSEHREVTNLYALWYTPDIWFTDDISTSINGTIDFEVLDHYEFSESEIDAAYGQYERNIWTVVNGDFPGYDVVQTHPGNPYTRVFTISGTVDAGDKLPMAPIAPKAGRKARWSSERNGVETPAKPTMPYLSPVT